MATIHALQRATDRLGIVLDTETVREIVQSSDEFASRSRQNESVAVRVRTLSSFVGHAWSDSSNGDTLIAIIRNRCVVTFMFRRRTQPFAPQYMSVDRVAIL